MSGLGRYDPQGINQPSTYDFPAAPFISLGEEKTLGQDFWAGAASRSEIQRFLWLLGNPSVLTTLTEVRRATKSLAPHGDEQAKSVLQELVQPYSFVRSCCGPNFETRRVEDSPIFSALLDVCHSLNLF